MLDWLRRLLGATRAENYLEAENEKLVRQLALTTAEYAECKMAQTQREASLQDRARGCRLEIWQDKASEYRWRLKSRNHCIIAESGEGYKRMENLEKSLALVCDVIEIAERKKP